MKIKISEVSRRTGLTKRAIRYYLEAGLISPRIYEKNAKEYRDYSEEDVRLLEAIAGLRRAGFSIEQIRAAIETPERIPALWHEYIASLKELGARISLLLETARRADESQLTDVFAVNRALTPVTRDMPLPHPESTPHFRYLDDIPISRESRERDRLQYARTRYVSPPNLLDARGGPGVRGPAIDPGFFALGTRAFEFFPVKKKRTNRLLIIIMLLILAGMATLVLVFGEKNDIYYICAAAAGAMYAASAGLIAVSIKSAVTHSR